MTERLTFHGDSISGNCYKLQLACAELGIDYHWVEMDILGGASRTPEFLAMNPNGEVPIAVLPDGRVLTESNAILAWLADGTALAGDGRFGRAEVLSWLFFEQYSHEPYIATSRFIIKYLGSPPDRQGDLAAKRDGGYRALDIMEQRLAAEDWLAGGAFSIADIALYAYTHVAGEGGFDLGAYPAVNRWLGRLASRPGHVAMRARSGGHDE